MTFYDYLCSFTACYQAHFNDPIPLREAYCLDIQHKYEFLPMEEGDLLAGRKRVLPVGFSNEPLLGRSVGWFYDIPRAEEALAAENATQAQRAHAMQLLDYWKTQETRKGLRESYPPEIARAMPQDIYWEHAQISFPLYRVVGAYLDYDKLLRLGLDGMRREIAARREKTDDTALYDACLMALDQLTEVCLRYREQADGALREALGHIAHEPPQSFYEAVQLSWLYSLISGVLNYGRMDDYLGDHLDRDLNAGLLSQQQALDILCSLWRLIDARKTVFHGRVIIGGKGRHNERAADRFARLAMEATRLTASAEPQLSLRFYEGQDPALLDQALDVIGEGKLYPMLYNDDVNIPSVMHAFSVSEQEATDYCFFGCGEYVINKKSIGSPNGIINLLKALEATLFNGVDPRSGKTIGLKLGGLCDFESFEAFYAAYREQLCYQFRLLAQQERLEYDYCGKVGAFLYISMLMDSCMERNRALLSGGVRYLGGTLETYGNINTANSLYAIKTLVYEQKRIAPQTLLDALAADFVGYERERRLLLDAPKYGNDLDCVDDLAAELHRFVCSSVRDSGRATGMHSYLVVIINNEANTILGRFTGASADGRKAGEPMANANNPVGGTDRNGITAMLRSLCKLPTDIHAGAVQNLTFSRELFCGHRDLTKAILMTYFRSGGQQAMINVLGRGELDDAIVHPERHQSLMVRVGGFSARFVTLAPDVQREIASRTLY